jgi:hypothetical protein
LNGSAIKQWGRSGAGMAETVLCNFAAAPSTRGQFGAGLKPQGQTSELSRLDTRRAAAGPRGPVKYRLSLGVFGSAHPLPNRLSFATPRAEGRINSWVAVSPTDHSEPSALRGGEEILSHLGHPVRVSARRLSIDENEVNGGNTPGQDDGFALTAVGGESHSARSAIPYFERFAACMDKAPRFRPEMSASWRVGMLAAWANRR